MVKTSITVQSKARSKSGTKFKGYISKSSRDQKKHPREKLHGFIAAEEMKRLLNIEYRILSRYSTFMILLSLYFIFLALVSYGFVNFLGDFSFNDGDQPVQLNLAALPIYRFPDIWHNMTYIASYFKFILAILVIMFISNEFEFRTLRQHIIDGMSRGQFVQSKFLSIGVISLLSTLFITLVILVLGFSHSTGSPASFSPFSGSIFNTS